jgi:hypothetical protein
MIRHWVMPRNPETKNREKNPQKKNKDKNKSGKEIKHLKNLHSGRRRRVWSFFYPSLLFSVAHRTASIFSLSACGAVTLLIFYSLSILHHSCVVSSFDNYLSSSRRARKRRRHRSHRGSRETLTIDGFK